MRETHPSSARWHLLGVAIASVLATPAGSVAQAAPQKKPPPETWAIVQIGDDFKVISTSQIKSEQKKITDDYNAAMKKYKEDKKKDPDAEKPVKAEVQGLEEELQDQGRGRRLHAKGAGRGRPEGRPEGRTPEGQFHGGQPEVGQQLAAGPPPQVPPRQQLGRQPGGRKVATRPVRRGHQFHHVAADRCPDDSTATARMISIVCRQTQSARLGVPVLGITAGSSPSTSTVR